ncbi:MAG: hypothetical protein AB3N64_12880 [Puniceicoccaceae bacterium]
MDSMRIYRFLIPLLLVGVSASFSSGQDESETVTLDYVLSRYVESMGGRANLQKIMSVRISGTVDYPDGTSHAITVLKKKPNLVRMILDTGTMRIIQGYDGKDVWFARESGPNQMVDRLRGASETSFIRDAPLEGVLMNAYAANAVLELGKTVVLDGMPCYQIIASFPGGAKSIHCIDREEFNERRIYQYDSDGKLLSELVPSEFELYDGVLFSMKTDRVKDGEIVSSVTVEDVQINMGILNAAFSPPSELPPR